MIWRAVNKDSDASDTSISRSLTGHGKAFHESAQRATHGDSYEASTGSTQLTDDLNVDVFL